MITEAVTIGSIEKYITDNAWDNGWIKPIRIKKEKELKKIQKEIQKEKLKNI